MCLVNDAVYIAKYTADTAPRYKPTGEIVWWMVTGSQFAEPYVFKKLCKEAMYDSPTGIKHLQSKKVVFDDMCETKSVTTALYLDMNEDLPDVSEQEKTVAAAVKKAKEFGITIDISKPTGDGELDPLLEEITKGHNYRFIGKVGRFCPIKPGCGGGLLMREKDGKYYAATGSKGYRWLESEMVQELKKEADIDRSYYDKMVDNAVDSISKYGDFEWFVSEDSYDNENNGICPF